MPAGCGSCSRAVLTEHLQHPPPLSVGGTEESSSTHPSTQHFELTRQQPHSSGAVSATSRQSHQHPKRRQTVPEPLPPSSSSAACEEGAKGLSVSEKGSEYVSACVSVLISVTLLPALVQCQHEVRASSTLPSDRYTHRQGAASLPTQEPFQTCLPLPAARGNTHQLHLGTQPFQDPVGSLRLLLQGGKKRGKKKLFVPSVYKPRLSAPALPSAKTTSQTSTEPSQIPSLPESGWKGSAQPADPQEKPVGEGLRRWGYHDFKTSELCPGSDPEP